MKIHSLRSWAVLASVLLTVSLANGTPKVLAPKYAEGVVPLTKDHEFFRTNPAPDFWALSPYYVSQINGGACSAASYAMIINAARSKVPQTVDDKLVSQTSLAEQAKDQFWGKAILQASVLTQDRFAELFKSGTITRSPILMSEHDSVLRPLFEKNGLKVVETKLIHVDDLSDQTRKKIRDLLIENEKSDRDFIVLDMVQGDLTGDPDGFAHVAVVGAFDAKTNRVLVMDPDREWYEPYWTSFDRLMISMNRLEKPTNVHHGLFYIKYDVKE